MRAANFYRYPDCRASHASPAVTHHVTLHDSAVVWIQGIYQLETNIRSSNTMIMESPWKSSHETNSWPLTTCGVEELGLPMRDRLLHGLWGSHRKSVAP